MSEREIVVEKTWEKTIIGDEFLDDRWREWTRRLTAESLLVREIVELDADDEEHAQPESD